ncbi:MAG: nuclear transport factor 2 family protein [Nonomuraea sp.]|nr:nuclear transport factor 2 family protein [Nonomuraea sp.]NUP61698.1 nuclear transport factor 2 family protein [Nonomuraea sp.]NUP79437.1 nuclear transport factor 2 family protein [Nonomuraea sp.]NUS01769.1 nuclear transport factor 2 family protein [Nonomuraea sp.]
MSTDRAILLQHDQSFFDALVANDLDRLRELLADDFVLVGVEDGAVADKAVLLDLVASGSLRFPKIESFPDEAIVRVIGNMGIVVGRTGMNFTNPDGSTFSAGSRYTHVYAAGSEQDWRLVSAQGTAIKG